MSRRYEKDTSILRFATPDTKLVVLGVATLLVSGVSYGLIVLTSRLAAQLGNKQIFSILTNFCYSAFVLLLIAGITIMMIAVVVRAVLPDSRKIRQMVEKGLFDYSCGNPLGFKEMELLPKVYCKNIRLGKFAITITATSTTVENIQDIASNISSSLNKQKYMKYAVVQADADIAFNKVTFIIEDVTISKQLVINSIAELTPKEPTKIIAQKDTYIDLKTSGSILAAGKTRSGKTTGIISILIQILLAGRDKYGSEVIIIDPKNAELSQLPHTYKLDENGEATAILDAMRRFADTIKKRQAVLNALSKKSGNAEKWYDYMSPSFIFLDEYVSLLSILPKKTAKDSTDYNIDTFSGVLRRIITMGASAGCFVIISIAEASVESGGLPSMLRSAMSTRILFKPTLTEGRLIWDSEKLKDFPERTYKAGDCWISSTSEGLDNVTFAHFPILKL